MLVNVNHTVKRGYKLSDNVLYNGKKYKIVAIDFRSDGEYSKIFLLNGYEPQCYDITSEEGDLYSFVVYDSDETLDRKYSLWVSCEQISKVKDDTKNAGKEICFKNKLSDFNKYQPSDFENIDDKRAIEKLLTIRKNMSCSEFKCSVCPLNLSNDGCAVDLGERYAKEHLDAIIEMYEIYHSVGTKNKLYALYTGMRGDFGGETFDRIIEANNYEDAYNEARDICIKIYKAYEGRHGLPNEKECKQYGLSYEDEINNCIVFLAMEVTSENIDKLLEEALSKSDIELLKKYNFNQEMI